MPTELQRKAQERINLARDIENNGFKMTPCSSYENEGRKCIMLPGNKRSSRCAECVCRKRSYDGLSNAQERNVPRESDWSKLDRQETILKEQEEQASA